MIRDEELRNSADYNMINGGQGITVKKDKMMMKKEKN